MFIPYSTDAPIYHWPLATVGLIVTNVAVFVADATGNLGVTDDWILVFGQGLHPVQWLSSVFMHANVLHLLGNMLFLWIFGLVVEGKLGWWKFLLCYLSIGMIQSMFAQLIMLGYSGPVPGALGASAAIFGIMGMAAVWAPMNDVRCTWMLSFRVGEIDIPIYFFCVLYIGLEVYAIVRTGGAMGSSWYHLAGAALGVPLAIVLLKSNVVDCEGWDVFHVARGEYGSNKPEPSPAEVATRVAMVQKIRDEGQRTNAQQQLQHYLQHGNCAAALKLHEKMKSAAGGLVLERGQLLALIKWLHSEKRWADSAPFMAEIIQRFPDCADPIRIKLAQICLVELSRPGKALDILEEVDLSKLSEQQAAMAKKIAAKARQLQQEGVVELDVESW